MTPTHTLTREQVSAAAIQQAAEELAIDVPIRSWATDGNAIVLYLASGHALRWTPPEYRSPLPSRGPSTRCGSRSGAGCSIPPGNLNRYRKSELQEMARFAGLDPGGLLKRDLVALLEASR